MIEITAPSRIHMALIDMNGMSGRIDGGAGLTLDACGIRLRARKADEIVINGYPELESALGDVAARLLPEGCGIEIDVLEKMPMHIGLGIGTQSFLSVAAAVSKLYGPDRSVRELSTIAGRGGTSGIGTIAFEKGGFIVDGGHRTSEKKAFAPSSKSRAPPAPLLVRYDFPEEWDVLLAIPAGRGLSGEEEAAFFKSVCPIPIDEVRTVSHIILMQMMPALLEKDIEAFGKAVDGLQEIGFNKRERAVQPEESGRVSAVMKKSGSFGVGLSSFGPVLYGFSENRRHSEEIRDAVLSEMAPGGRFIITKAKNTGAVCHRV